MVVILWAIGLHEYCHAKFADMAGDFTPRMMGRVTLNPFKHLDPLGTICLVISSVSGIGIGWGKPVMVQPERMRNPRWDHFVSVLAGPVSNLVQAVVYALVMKILQTTGFLEIGGAEGPNVLAELLLTGVLINTSLFVFNLIPLGPLDGHWLVGAFLPEKERYYWYRFNRGIGSVIFLVLVLIPAGSPYDVLGRFYVPLVLRIARLLLGLG